MTETKTRIATSPAELMELFAERVANADIDGLLDLYEPDARFVSNFWTMSGTAPDGTVVNEGGVSADVVRRQADGSWRVLIDQPRGGPTDA